LILLDLAWPSRWKAVEIDGLATHASGKAFEYDLDRQNLIWDCGWQLRRFPARVVLKNPSLFVAEVRAFLAA
jgi:very-short-patch-repair endonuclease